MDKKGIELSINFIVILIISIIIFSLGATFIYNLGSEATELQSMTTDELDRKISNLACEGSEKVCFGFDKKIIEKGKLGIFSLRITNILASQDFEITVTRPSPCGYKKDNTEIPRDNCNDLMVKPALRTFRIEQNEEKDLAIGIQVPKKAVSGTYILDVYIKKSDGELYNPLYKLYVQVP